MYSIDDFAELKLQELEKKSLRRRLASTARRDRGTTERDGKSLISFCCNDYLGLSKHPQVKKDAIDALSNYGVGAGASRLVTGNHPLYESLERGLAEIKSTEAATVFGSGYLSNLGIIPSFMGSNDLCIGDELCHSSLHAGMQSSRAKVQLFRHNDMENCKSILTSLRSSYEKCLLITEGVFSMDGDRAPLLNLCNLADEFDSWLFVDDAHGFGVLGNGAGSAAEAGVGSRVDLQMGTLSKSVGSYGGFLCGSQPVCNLAVNRARTLIYETGLPPASVAASLASLKLIKNDSGLVSRPLKKARYFTNQLSLPEAQSAIVPLILGQPKDTLAASAQLMEEGFLVTPIRPPTVPAGTSRLRFTFCADQPDEDIEMLIQCIRKLGIAG